MCEARLSSPLGKKSQGTAMHLEAFTHRTAYTKLSRALSVCVALGNLWEMSPRGLYRTVLLSGHKTCSCSQEGNQILAVWWGWGLSVPKSRRFTEWKGKTELPSSQSMTWTCWEGVHSLVLSWSWVCLSSMSKHPSPCAVKAKCLMPWSSGPVRRRWKEMPITSAPSCWQHHPGTWCPRTPKAAEQTSACSRQKSQRASMGERLLWDRHRGSSINLNRKWN